MASKDTLRVVRFVSRFNPIVWMLAAALYIGQFVVPQSLQSICYGLEKQEETEKPNIVFFLIDDLGRNDIGFMGSKTMKSPNIDRLAREGTILDAHYVQPVCSPTRACLMTGRYATRTGVYTIVRPNAKWGLPLEERTLANALADAGYETAICGKWHLGEFEARYRPTMRGFQHQYGHFFGALDYFTHKRDGSEDWYRNDQPLQEQGYSTHLVAEEACRLIRNRDQAKPLFLYVPFNGVHSPLQVPPKYEEPFSSLTGNKRTLAGMIAAVDEAIGKIVSQLEASQIRKKTLILFSSDNGGPNPEKLSSNGELRAGKGTLYEGGIRVCAFANWPGKVPEGALVKEPMHMVDWYPTLVRLGGGSIEQKLPIDGKDVWPMIVNQERSPHDSILLVQSPQRAAVRVGNLKLMMLGDVDADADTAPRRNRKQSKAPSWELYDLAQDPSETKNLYSIDTERDKRLRSVLDVYMKEAVEPGNAKAN